MAPLVLALLLVLLLPESVRYMVAKLHPAERIRAVLRRIGPEAAAAADFTLAEAAPTQGAGINLVLSRSYLLGSAMLWLAYFMGLVIFYALVNWMPVLFRDAGLDARNAALIAALFPLGGVGTIGFRLADGPDEPEPGHRCRLRADRRRGLGDRPGGRQSRPADGRGVPRRRRG